MAPFLWAIASTVSRLRESRLRSHGTAKNSHGLNREKIGEAVEKKLDEARFTSSM